MHPGGCEREALSECLYMVTPLVVLYEQREMIRNGGSSEAKSKPEFPACPLRTTSLALLGMPCQVIASDKVTVFHDRKPI
ncbi:hypothetical protein DSL72_000854 [Monilinia vaccinii-corymbosi]|uniref:Uncharacterized protein n=1 Tax=Monilinia vaccinii-corymbosi TaxID=61207 RepID=A0A8A3P6Y7_9HELO|nr:hypothetical protein DSL72_000854 [Monilinia vaccinii-corymbosi]